MKRFLIMAAAVALVITTGNAKKPDVKPSVTYAPTWEAAVAEGKLLNLPIVVHSHGFG